MQPAGPLHGAGPEAAPAPAAAPARIALLYAPRTAVIVGGIPGAGKSTLLARVVRDGDARVLDSAEIRDRCRARLGAAVPYALHRPIVHAVHQWRVWRALGAGGPVVVHDCATRAWLRRLMLARARRAGRPVCLLLLHVEGEVARSGQHARGRRVRARAMRRHERRWRRLVTPQRAGPAGRRGAGGGLRRGARARPRRGRRRAADAIRAPLSAVRLAGQPATGANVPAL
jgi:predicted kinase